VVSNEAVIQFGIVFHRGEVPVFPHFVAELLFWFHPLVHGNGGHFYILCHFDFRPYVFKTEISFSFEHPLDHFQEPFVIVMSCRTDKDPSV
jgi:hypothetical protein